MQSNTCSPPLEAPTLADGAAAWSRLCQLLDARARLDVEIVAATGDVQRSGAIEHLEGLTLDTVLSLTHRLPRADRAMQLTAAEVLAHMPATQRLFAARVLSWGLVRGIVAEARRLDRDARAALDARIAASAEQAGVQDPDDLLDAVAVAAHELRTARAAKHAEDRAARGNFCYAQPGLLGRGTLYSELDNCSLAGVVGGIDALTPPDDGRTLAQRRAAGLVALATHRCPDDDTATSGPHGGAGRLDRAVPALLAAVDVNDVSVNAAGRLLLDAPGCIPTLTARVVEALAADATVQAVLFDGARPLAVTRKVWARDIPADTRLAVTLRDRGDRFPGSRRPIGHLHHLDKTGHGHHPEHLAGLSGPSHRRLHNWGWSSHVDPDTAAMTFTRGERTWTTLPRGTHLQRPPPADPDDNDHDDEPGDIPA